MIKTINTVEAPSAIGPYSQGVIAGGLLFLSGSIPLDPKTGQTVGGSIAAQTERVMLNIAALLKAAGIGFGQVVKTTCFLTSMDFFADFNEVYAGYFVSKPARSTVAVAGLPKGVDVEVEVIAKI